jgi:peptidoglycan/LPS O-acetylase OafA/YrhL
MYVDGRSATEADGAKQSSAPPAHALAVNANLVRLLACFLAAVVYVWQEQREYSFPQVHLAVFVLGVGVLSLILCLFRRGPSRIQPPEPIAVTLRFIGRRTLEIYAIQLAGFELIVKLVPDLAP